MGRGHRYIAEIGPVWHPSAVRLSDLSVLAKAAPDHHRCTIGARFPKRVPHPIDAHLILEAIGICHELAFD